MGVGSNAIREQIFQFPHIRLQSQTAAVYKAVHEVPESAPIDRSEEKLNLQINKQSGCRGVHRQLQEQFIENNIVFDGVQ